MRGLYLVAVMVLLFSVAVLMSADAQSDGISEVRVRDRAYVSHEPIRINSDSEMDSIASSEGWSGSGTWLSPYIIENYEIDAHGGSALFVGNTTRYFIVRYGHFYNSSTNVDYLAGAIELYNVKYGFIYYNNISDSLYGIYFYDYTSQVDNSYNTFYNLTYGTYAYFHCSSITTSRNEYLKVRNPVLYRGVINGRISYNKMANTIYRGIMVDGNNFATSGISITRNTIETGSSAEGIYLYGFVEHCRIENNTVNYSNTGIRLYSGVNDTVIANNTLYHTLYYGVYVVSSSNTLVYNNSFAYCNGATDTYNSAHVQAYSNGTGNVWFQGGRGNYWSDWTAPDSNHDGIVDQPYVLSGDAGMQDPYPLTEPPVPIPEFWSMLPVLFIAFIALLSRQRR